MNARLIKSLSKIQHKLYKLTREGGILDNEDAETIEYKLSNLVHLAKNLSFEGLPPIEDVNFNDYRANIIANLKKSQKTLSLGELDVESGYHVFEILKSTRTLVNGLKLLAELLSLEEEEDIPEYIFESLEPFVDIETGDVYESECAELESAILNILYSNREIAHPVQSSAVKSELDLLTDKMAQLKVDLDSNLIVELGDGLTAYANPKPGLSTQIKNIHAATRFYFEPTHQARTDEIARAAESLYSAQHNGKSTLPQVTSGELIIASAEALRSVFLLGETLKDYEERLAWDNVDISIRRKPSAKNRGNLFIRNVGRYGYRDENKGGRKDILDDFEDIIAYSGEDKLFNVLQQYGAKPFKITCNMLDLPNNNLGKKLLGKLQHNMFLIFCAEIARYFPIEGIRACVKSKKMPYAVALGLGIELLAAGHIEMEDLFEKDARLGLPTGLRILDNSKRVSVKYSRILNRYQGILRESYQSVDTFLTLYPKGRLVPNTEEYVKVLERTFGDNLERKPNRFEH